MRRLALALVIAAAISAVASSAQAAPEDYGIASFEGSLASSQAGAHADFTTSFDLKSEPGGAAVAPSRSLSFEIPPGLLANAEAFPKCTTRQLATAANYTAPKEEVCPLDSQVGVVRVKLGSLLTGGTGTNTHTEPVYNMVPAPGEPARLGFIALVVPTIIDTQLDPARDYAVTASLDGLSAKEIVTGAPTTLWGDPTDPSHDNLRITPYESYACAAAPCTAPGGETRHTNLLPTPFMVSPTSCSGPGALKMGAESYEGFSDSKEATLPQLSGCGLLDFSPHLSLAPTTEGAESGTGLNVKLTFPQDGFSQANLLAESHLKRAEVTLPEGVTVNPSQAVGLGVCSEADFAKETATSAPNEGCPESAKIGSVTAKSPALSETAEGSLFIAKPKENPFGTLIALYMTLKIPDRGVVVRLAGKVTPDSKTGQLITSFDDLPQLPVSSFDLHFREGARSPLVTPPRCGTYTAPARFTSWAQPDKVTTTSASFQITRGVNGGPCPSPGAPPFAPGFDGGTLNNAAGSYSPFDMRLTRRDGDQDLTKFSATLPPGMVAKLAGTSQCPDAAIEAAKAKDGKDEQANPSCPASSEIGSVLAGAGVGQVLTYATGKIYLAGPYNGAPLSVAAIVPAVAGPFDVGTVVTREALSLNPRTGIVHVDGARSDPIPHILAGIPLKVRDVRVHVDRPDFTLNPTSCDPFAIDAQLWGGGADVFSAADDSPVSLAERFQAANCSNLGFKPRLDLKLIGGTTRGGHPALRGTYTPRPGDANLKGLVLRFPRSAFLDQAHIRTICTRVQFAAKACPEGAVYGHARAFTPLLDEPLEGPVYLRSSDHNLPDFVADLHGLVDIEAVARIDSKNGGIRATFTEVPDAPISKVVVSMQGQKKGLIVNSTDLCRAKNRANAQFEGQNGKRLSLHPQMRAQCGGARKKR
jgi:hypothetical protein